MAVSGGTTTCQQISQTTQYVVTVVHLSQCYVVNCVFVCTKLRKSHVRTVYTMLTTFTTSGNEPNAGRFTRLSTMLIRGALPPHPSFTFMVVS
jgi:hypothetical protein